MIRFIGDVQGHYGIYGRIIGSGPPSIQVGDLGIGKWRRGKPPDRAMARGNHRLIRGNHDDPAECRRHPQWIRDGQCEDGMMFIGGAFSVDRASRKEGYDWWPDEELSAAELRQIVDLYLERKPRIMVTHDCPEEVAGIVMSRIPRLGPSKPGISSRTRLALQEMWSAHAPALWIFGHYHMSFDQVLHGGREIGTRFIGLAELEFRDIDLEARSRRAASR